LLSYGPTYFRKEQLLRDIELTVFDYVKTWLCSFIEPVYLVCRWLYRQLLFLHISRLLQVCSLSKLLLLSRFRELFER